MSLIKQWEDNAYKEMTQEEYDAFWDVYLEKEKKIYQILLSNKQDTIKGTVPELSQKYNMDVIDFVAFMSGINSSLVEEINIDDLTEESSIDVKIDFEKLLFNMHSVLADWLYTMPEWNNIFTEEKQKEIETEYKKSKTVVKEPKIGRNDPCPCGSGKKYKKCCGKDK